MSRVVEPTFVLRRVTFAVTTGAPQRVIDHGLRIGRNPACPSIERIARVALERSRQVCAEEPRSGDRALAIPTPHRIGRLDGAAMSRIDLLEQRQLFALAKPG